MIRLGDILLLLILASLGLWSIIYFIAKGVIL